MSPGLPPLFIFPRWKTQIDDYEVDVKDYRDAYSLASSTRDKNNIIAKDKAKDKAILSTIKISNAVMQLANGGLAAFASTNLPIKKTDSRLCRGSGYVHTHGW